MTRSAHQKIMPGESLERLERLETVARLAGRVVAALEGEKAEVSLETLSLLLQLKLALSALEEGDEAQG